MTPFYESSAQVDGKSQVVIYNARWEDVWPTLGLAPKDVALCWADPPYGIGAVEQRGGLTRNAGKGSARRPHRPVIGDDRPFDPRMILMFPRLVLWGANNYASRLRDTNSWWTWDKKGMDWQITHGDSELAWTNLGGTVRTARIPWYGGHRTGSSEGYLHPTQKPVALCEWGFQRAGLKPGQIVFAPYLGSGPEVRAALNMGLRIIGCEVDADYCRTVVTHRCALAAPKRGQEGQRLLFGDA